MTESKPESFAQRAAIKSKAQRAYDHMPKEKIDAFLQDFERFIAKAGFTDTQQCEIRDRLYTTPRFLGSSKKHTPPRANIASGQSYSFKGVKVIVERSHVLGDEAMRTAEQQAFASEFKDLMARWKALAQEHSRMLRSESIFR